jgi:hypothetical protein
MALIIINYVIDTPATTYQLPPHSPPPQNQNQNPLPLYQSKLYLPPDPAEPSSRSSSPYDIHTKNSEQQFPPTVPELFPNSPTTTASWMANNHTPCPIHFKFEPDDTTTKMSTPYFFSPSPFNPPSSLSAYEHTTSEPEPGPRSHLNEEDGHQLSMSMYANRPLIRPRPRPLTPTSSSSQASESEGRIDFVDL